MANVKPLGRYNGKVKEFTAGDKIDPAFYNAGGTASISAATIAFTDKDTFKRVTITDASVLATSKIVTEVRRPDEAINTEDGILYVVNVIKVAVGSFDILISATIGGFEDVTDTPPNETITLYYLIG